jgi:hypothetical protein
MAQLGQSEAPVPYLYRAEGEGGVGDEAGHAEAEGHVVVDADHVSAPPLIDVGPCDPRAGTGVGVAVKVGHGEEILLILRRPDKLGPRSGVKARLHSLAKGCSSEAASAGAPQGLRINAEKARKVTGQRQYRAHFFEGSPGLSQCGSACATAASMDAERSAAWSTSAK